MILFYVQAGCSSKLFVFGVFGFTVSGDGPKRKARQLRFAMRVGKSRGGGFGHVFQQVPWILQTLFPQLSAGLLRFQQGPGVLQTLPTELAGSAGFQRPTESPTLGDTQLADLWQGEDLPMVSSYQHELAGEVFKFGETCLLPCKLTWPKKRETLQVDGLCVSCQSEGRNIKG